MTPIMKTLYREYQKPKQKRRIDDKHGALESLASPNRLVIEVTDVVDQLHQVFEQHLEELGHENSKTIDYDFADGFVNGLKDYRDRLFQSHDMIWVEGHVVEEQGDFERYGVHFPDFENAHVLIKGSEHTMGFSVTSMEQAGITVRAATDIAPGDRRHWEDFQADYGTALKQLYFMDSESFGYTPSAVIKRRGTVKTRAKAKKWEYLLREHKVARIMVDGKPIEARAESHANGGVLPYHMVRGHYHRYHTREGLIRKWIHAFWRGNKEVGTVVKTYKAESAHA